MAMPNPDGEFDVSTWVDITPPAHLIDSIRAEKPNLLALLCEAIDNSFDFGATLVEIEISDRLIRIMDDGVGITKDRELAIVTLGLHAPGDGKPVGRYGIGVTSQAINTGDVFSVFSRSADGEMRVKVNWNDVKAVSSKGAGWKAPPPIWSKARPERRTGTAVTIEQLRSAPKKGTLQRVREKLALVYQPAAVSGKRITMNNDAIAPLAEPELTDIVEETIDMGDGRTAHVRGGIRVDRAHPLKLVHLGYKHRVLKPDSSFGCGNYTGMTAIFVRIDLKDGEDKKWQLTRYKDGLADADESDALEERVEELLRPILEKCNAESLEANVLELQDRLNANLPPELVPVRPRKKKDKPDGPPPPPKPKRPPGNRSKDADESTTGPAFDRRPNKNGLMIEIVDSLCTSHGIGQFQKGKTNRIQLAKDCPVISALVTKRDEVQLMAHAMTVYVQGKVGEVQSDLEPFGLRVWKLLERQEQIRSIGVSK